MKMLKPLVFFGTEQFSLPSLEALIEAGWPVKLVVTKPDSKRGRGQALVKPAVKKLAEANNIPVTQPTDISSIGKELAQMQAPLAVLVAYGKIIPQEIIDIFPSGIVNVHPSLLPKYRGPAPIEAAILNGDRITGVSLMKLTEQMDAGPVYAQHEVPLTGKETRSVLYESLAKIGADLLIKNLSQIAEGTLQAESQEDASASYTKLLKKDDGLIDFSGPANLIERKIRAYQGFPKAQAEILGQRVIVLEGHAVNNGDSSDLFIKTGDGFIQITKLIAPSGRTMAGKDFIRGYDR